MGRMGSETEIGKGLWATGSLFLPSASGWSSLSSGSVAKGLRYTSDLEKMETTEADAARSQLDLGFGCFQMGNGDDNDGIDGDDGDRWCSDS